MQLSVQSAPPLPLLQLPDPCLVAVLSYFVDDPRSVCSAARAHSRLHQAAAVALSKITLLTDPIYKADLNNSSFQEYFEPPSLSRQQQQVDSVLLYLAQHGKHVSSLAFRGSPGLGFRGGILSGRENTPTLRELPPSLTQLSSLELQVFGVQLQSQPGSSYKGVIGGVTAPLKQLCLTNCRLLDGYEGLAAALAQIPDLEHLSIINSRCSAGRTLPVPLDDVLPKLQQLTYLNFEASMLSETTADPPAILQQLPAATRLADLRLAPTHRSRFAASALAGAQQLTRLELFGSLDLCFDPAGLSGVTALQQLNLLRVQPDGAAGVVELLSEMQHLQQLTCLKLYWSLHDVQPHPPAAAYSALTASSSLQHLDISSCCLPVGVWQYVFPAGRQLPHLRVLNMANITCLGGGTMVPPEGASLVSCCPQLQELWLESLKYEAESLSSLQGLSGLHKLYLRPGNHPSEGLEGVCELTDLRHLQIAEFVQFHRAPDSGLLLQLTQLRQLTHLSYGGAVNVYRSMDQDCKDHGWTFKGVYNQAPGSEPVWRQVLRFHLKHRNRAVAKQAAALLKSGE